MKSDDLEHRLRGLRSAALPAAWRQEILATARDASLLSESSEAVSRAGWGELWPTPWAWAGVASLWLVILGLNVATNAAAPTEAIASMPISPQALQLVWAEREQLWRDAALPSEPSPAATTPPSRPRRSGAVPFRPVSV